MGQQDVLVAPPIILLGEQLLGGAVAPPTPPVPAPMSVNCSVHQMLGLSSSIHVLVQSRIIVVLINLYDVVFRLFSHCLGIRCDVIISCSASLNVFG